MEAGVINGLRYCLNGQFEAILGLLTPVATAGEANKKPDQLPG